MLGPKQRQLAAYVASANDGSLDSAGQQWKTGESLLRRLASLVPPPRVNLTRFHGVFAPGAKVGHFCSLKQSSLWRQTPGAGVCDGIARDALHPATPRCVCSEHKKNGGPVEGEGWSGGAEKGLWRRGREGPLPGSARPRAAPVPPSRRGGRERGNQAGVSKEPKKERTP